MKWNPKLCYPLFLIETDRAQKYSWFFVVNSRFGFNTFGRVPNSAQFSDGLMFACDGSLFSHKGSAGWPRFSPSVCLVLDNLGIPGLVSKIAEAVTYFGPQPVSHEKLDLASFKSAVIESIEKYRRKTKPQLRKIIAPKGSFREVIEGIHWWQWTCRAIVPPQVLV
ncbi:hypothetical protein [Sulfitobacter geojensis]|uniref:hypothetical protein n=1 Tax=Sulfitobacter geojensis TaxID=1342299 RepID=UPI003B8DF197